MERVLLIGSETLTRATNWADRTNAFLFGDGAGAVVVEAVPGEGALLGWDLGRGRVAGVVALRRSRFGHGHARPGGVPQGGPGHGRLGPAVARAGQGRPSTTSPCSCPTRPTSASWRRSPRRLGLPAERVASVIDRTGNTSSASIPLALVDAAEHGRLVDGDLVLLAGFGAGMTWASAVWRWGR